MGNKKVTLTIEGVTQADKKTSTKIPYINPNISDDVMRTFAQKCAALTDDTHTGTTKTIDEDITTAEAEKPKVTLLLSTYAMEHLNFSSAPAYDQEDFDAERESPLFSGTGKPEFTYEIVWGPLAVRFPITIFWYNGKVYFNTAAPITIDETSDTLTVKIYFKETATTAATTAQLVIGYSGTPTLTIL